MNKQRTGLVAALLISLFGSHTARAEDLDAWSTAKLMGVGVNIGNTLENTTTWETGWGNPRITKEFVQSLARLGFKTVRVPVAWDTYARNGRIAEGKLARVGEVVDWITAAGMFCVVNIHWDGGWIDSSDKARFSKTFATFSAEAEQKYVSYWTQIASYLAARNEQLIFEALNEETKFDGAGSTQKAYATLTHVNQLFIDTVRQTGDDKWTIAKAEVESLRTDMGAMMTQVRVVPNFADGQPDGFKVFAIRPGSLFAKIGLQNGDVIKNINGIAIQTPEQAMAAYQRLSSETSIKIELVRRNENKTLTYDIR
jgi:type II secretion system protein C